MDGAGRNIIAISAHGTRPNTIPDNAIILPGYFLTIPFQLICIIEAKRTIKKTCVSIAKFPKFFREIKIKLKDILIRLVKNLVNRFALPWVKA